MGSRLEGSVESVVDGRVIGWVWDPEEPGSALEVEVHIDGKPVVSGAAEVERRVLADAGIGTGRYGFDLALPEELGGEGSRRVLVTAGPGQTPLVPFTGFETISRFPDGPWGLTKFLVDDGAPPPEPYVPEEEEPLPDRSDAALVGREGWLFAIEDRDACLRLLAGEEALDSDALEWAAEALDSRHRAMRGLGVPYLFAIAPAKERACSEFLPPGAQLAPRSPAARLDPLLRARGTAEAFDLLPSIREAGLTAPFPLTDSRWSDRGAFSAYRELMREAAKRVVELDDPVAVGEARFTVRSGFSGDLAEKPRLALRAGELGDAGQEGAREEDVEVVDVAALRSLRMPAPEHLEATPGRAPHLYEVPDGAGLPRAVLVGDACCLALIPWLAEHFRRFVFLWAGEELPLEPIELEMPDIVIHVVAEHELARGR